MSLVINIVLEETSIAELPGTVRQTSETNHKESASIRETLQFPDSLPSKGIVDNPFSHLLSASSQNATPSSSNLQASDDTQTGKPASSINRSASLFGAGFFEVAPTKFSDGVLGSMLSDATNINHSGFALPAGSAEANAINGPGPLLPDFKGFGLNVKSDSKSKLSSGKSSPAPTKTSDSTKSV